jgi:death-on-curing protein
VTRPRHRWRADPDADPAELAAALGFGLVRDHPYIDGNKRIALIAITAFLDLNGLTLVAPNTEVVVVILAVASGEMTEPELAAWIREGAR